ncbi:MAG: MBL fold metallo-hydrolase [Lachnospiraceae bacterium]|nr:MBL fold metallo-hydrolase [Lachnospiraceae bacterium]
MAKKKSGTRPSERRSRRFQQQKTQLKWQALFSFLVMAALVGLMLLLRMRVPDASTAVVVDDSVDVAAGTMDTPPAIRDPAQTGRSFEIPWFDVGEGDGALVSCDGAHMLIDGGPSDASDMIYTVLKDRNITYLDYMICTHTHEDHAGGLAGALQAADVGKAYAPEMNYAGRSYQGFLNALQEQDKSITRPVPGESFLLGSAEVTILAPIDMTLAEEIENNGSIMLRIVYGDTAFLFPGDAESAEELSVLDTGADIRSTVLKAGHHGSFSSSTDVFLDAVSPTYCVISCGEGNPYEHPHEVVLRRLAKRDITVYRTDLQGDITCKSDGETVTFTTERQSAPAP